MRVGAHYSPHAWLERKGAFGLAGIHGATIIAGIMDGKGKGFLGKKFSLSRGFLQDALEAGDCKAFLRKFPVGGSGEGIFSTLPVDKWGFGIPTLLESFLLCAAKKNKNVYVNCKWMRSY